MNELKVLLKRTDSFSDTVCALKDVSKNKQWVKLNIKNGTVCDNCSVTINLQGYIMYFSFYRVFIDELSTCPTSQLTQSKY